MRTTALLEEELDHTRPAGIQIMRYNANTCVKLHKASNDLFVFTRTLRTMDGHRDIEGLSSCREEGTYAEAHGSCGSYVIEHGLPWSE